MQADFCVHALRETAARWGAPEIVKPDQGRQFEQTLRTCVNGLVVQQAHIGEETICGPHCVVADIARHITLVAGDVILMGTP